MKTNLKTCHACGKRSPAPTPATWLVLDLVHRVKLCPSCLDEPAAIAAAVDALRWED